MPPPPEPPRCQAGELERADGTCQPAGLPPDMACPPGTRDTGEACVPAGVPVDGCAAGFVHDGDGCEALLPPGPCPAGLMAVPGETECRAIASCGSGRWGDLPIGAGTIHVDAAYTSGDSDGSEAKPFMTIDAGVAAAPAGALVAVAAGSYATYGVTIDKPLRVLGRCPAMVEVTASNTNFPAFYVTPGATGTEIGGMSISAAFDGIVVSGAEVTLAQLSIHDCAVRGITAEDTLGSTHVTVRGSLLDGNHEVGFYTGGAAVVMEGTVVRETQPNAAGVFGSGLAIETNPTTGSAASIDIRGSVVEWNHEAGLYILGGTARVEGSVIRGTGFDATGAALGILVQNSISSGNAASVDLVASAVESNYGIGMWVVGGAASVERTMIRDNASMSMSGGGAVAEPHPQRGARASIVVDASVFAANHHSGLLLAGASATLTSIVVRDTQVHPDGTDAAGIVALVDPDTGLAASIDVSSSVIAHNRGLGIGAFGATAVVDSSVVADTDARADGEGGAGIVVGYDETTGSATFGVQRSIVERNREVGILVGASTATVHECVVRDTLPNQTGKYGMGIVLQFHETGLESHGELQSTLIENNRDLGVFVSGSEALLRGVVVRDTQPDAAAYFGNGVRIQSAPTTREPSAVDIFATLVERSSGFGIVVFDSTATIEQSTVRATAPRASDGLFGDGIAVRAYERSAAIELRTVQVHDSARASVSSFGAAVSLSGCTLTCSQFTLEGEAVGEQPYSFEDLGGNSCGCPDPNGDCKVISAGIAVPEPFEQP